MHNHACIELISQDDVCMLYCTPWKPATGGRIPKRKERRLECRKRSCMEALLDIHVTNGIGVTCDIGTCCNICHSQRQRALDPQRQGVENPEPKARPRQRWSASNHLYIVARNMNNTGGEVLTAYCRLTAKPSICFLQCMQLELPHTDTITTVAEKVQAFQ